MVNNVTNINKTNNRLPPRLICAGDRGFEPRSDQTKDYKIGICCFTGKHTALKRKSKDWFDLESR